jgi:ClpP class serine protease
MARKTNTLTRKTKGFASKRKALGAPDIDSMFDQTGLEGLPPNSAKTLQESADKEVDDMMASIRENRKNHAERFRDIESGEFWLCVCFQSRTQKEEFIDKLLEKYDPNNETFGDKYVNGLELAAMLDIPVEPIVLEAKKSRLAPKSMRNMEVI